MKKETKYFVQRMDGVLLLSFLASEAEVVNVRNDFGAAIGKPFCPGANAHGRINYFGYVWKDIHQQAKAIIKKIKQEPDFLGNVLKMWKERVRKLRNFERKISRINLKKLTDEELIKVFKKLVSLYQEEYSPALLCDAFGLHTEKIITERLKKVVQKRKELRKFASYLEILAFPKKISWANKEEASLLVIAKKIKSNKRLGKILIDNITKAKKEINKNTSLTKLLKEHTENFYWIENSYAKGIRLKEDYFLRKIRRILKEDIDIEKKIKEIESFIRKVSLKKKVLIQKLRLNKEIKDMFAWIEFFGFLHDARKGVMMEVYYWISLILKKIGQRLDLSLYQMYYTDHHQIEKMLIQKKVDKRLIKKRIKMCAYLIWPNKYKILIGNKAEWWHQELLGGRKMVIGEIKGVSASSGVAIGKAKIVKDIKEGYKIKKGDILVTGMTRPHWMSFIKKASAIVTDEGGITCHAAIVSREMGIPCIIATKIATKIIKNNYLIEVNTNHNRIKILKK